MPNDTPTIPTATDNTQTPETPAPVTGGNTIPESYAEYLNQTKEKNAPIFRLPLGEKITLFDSVKPKGAGDALALGVAKTMLHKQKEVVQAPDKALGNRMLKQHADVLGEMSKQPKEELTPTQQQDLDARTKEFNQQLQKLYDIPKDAIKENVILPVPRGWNAPELKAIKARQPNWSGEFIQLRKDPQTGEMSWEGYNKPTAGTQTLTPVKVIADTFNRKWDGKKWVTHEPDEKDVQKYWDKEYNSPDVSEGATRLSGVLQSEQKEGNYRLTKLMMNNPELAKAYKSELETATPESLSTAVGNVKLLQNAIKKAYNLNTKITDVQKSFSDFQFNVAVDAYNKFNDFAESYNKQQDDLTAKIASVTDATLRAAGKGKELDNLYKLRADMMRNPGNITDAQRKEYYDASLQVIKDASTLTAAQPFIEEFNKNIDAYKDAYQKSVS